MFISGFIMHQMLAITPAVFGSFMIGTGSGWMGPIFETYTNSSGDFSLTDDDCSRMVSLHYVGMLIGCLVATALVDVFGRNAMIYLSAIGVLVSWTSTALTKNVTLHLLIRFAFGTSLGINIAITPIYISENSSPHVRGVFSSLGSVFFFAGQFAGSLVATFCAYENAARILVGLSVINVASAVLLREPAQHLLAKGRKPEAEDRFFWLRGEDETVKKEFDQMKTKLADEIGGFSFSFLLDNRIRVVCISTSLSFLTGFPALISMTSMTLAPTKQFTSNELATLYQLALLVGVLITPLIIDRFDRRTLWTISTFLCLVFHLITLALFYSIELAIQIPCYSWLLFGSIAGYGAVFAALVFPLCNVARGELLPQKFRATGTCLSVVMNGILGSVVGHSFLWIANHFGMKANFAYFAVSSFALLMYSYFCLPETRGMSLMEIENFFEKSKKEDEES